MTIPVAGILSRQAPDFLRRALGEALGKEVRIKEILYRFPASFDIDRFEVREKGRFAGEISFSAGRMSLTVSPLSLSRRALILERVEVRDADVQVWKTGGRLVHALSEAAKRPAGVPETAVASGPSAPAGAAFPLVIREFRLLDGRFRLADFDVDEKGFVFAFERIEADVRDIALPLQPRPTAYRVTASLSQGRDQKAAAFDMKGRTNFIDLDTTASMALTGLYLPYFRPYYSQVTPAEITSGTLDTNVTLTIAAKELTADVGFTVTGLLFGAYESGNSLFGLKAEEILAFLQDAGRLKLPITVKWNLADRSTRPRDVIRRGIERSLKATVLGNVGNIMRYALKKYEEKDAAGTLPEAKSDRLKEAIEKVKELFG